MAKKEHLKILNKGREQWNAWHVENMHSGIDLSGEDFSGQQFLGFDFQLVNFSGSKFIGCNLAKTNMSFTDLTGADLSQSDMWFTDLSSALLTYSTFEGARLPHARFMRTGVHNAIFSNSTFGFTIIGMTDLSWASVERIQHLHPSVVDIHTLRLTASQIQDDNLSNMTKLESFFISCGLDQHQIALFRAYIGKDSGFASVFISYAHQDISTAEIIRDTLILKGIRCWLDTHDMNPGDRIMDGLKKAIQTHDRVLLLCSKQSLNSPWVANEIHETIEREKKENRTILIPIDIDGYLFDRDNDLSEEICSRSVLDYVNCKSINDFFMRLERTLSLSSIN